MICPNCGREIPGGSRFCGKCGARINIQASQNNEDPVNSMIADVPVPAKKTKKTGLIIAISAAAVVIVAAVILLFTIVLPGKSGSEDETEVLEETEQAAETETQAESEDADDEDGTVTGQEIYYTLATTFVEDRLGNGGSYSESKYTNGVITESMMDYYALNTNIGISVEYSYYVSTAQYNSTGNFQETELCIIFDDHDYVQVMEFEYEYNSSGNPVCVHIDVQEEQYGDEYEYYIDITLSYDEDGSLECVFAQVDAGELEEADYAGDLYLFFSESSGSAAMTIQYEAIETYECEVLYEFDPDGNLMEISCDGGFMLSVAAYAANILSYCGAASDYTDQNLTVLIASGGSVSYQYNDQGECTYQYIEYGDNSDAITYEYIYDDGGKLSQKIEHNDGEDYYLVTYYEY